LKHRVDGLIPIHTGIIENVATKGGEVRLGIRSNDGSIQLTADHVIAATGYKPDVRRIPFLEPLVSEIACLGGSAQRALPKLDRAYQSSVPGLHFAGALSAPTFGPSMRFIYGVRFTSERMVPALMRTPRTQAVTSLSRQPA